LFLKIISLKKTNNDKIDFIKDLNRFLFDILIPPDLNSDKLLLNTFLHITLFI